MDIDASDFADLAADLDRQSRGDLVNDLRPVVMRGAGNVVRAMQADMGGSQHFSQVAPSIGFDMVDQVQSSTAEIGPATGGRVVGDLAHLAYFGGANGGGGTVRDPEVHLEAEAPNLEEYAGKVLDDLLGRLS